MMSKDPDPELEWAAAMSLHPGPTLIRRDWEYDEARGEGHYVKHEVTEHASRYLFEPVALAPDLTLRDIFLLIDVNPLLQQIFAQNWAAELMHEIMTGSVVSPSIEDPEGIEYLELYQVWSKNSSSGELQPIHRLDFHGIGFVLKEDIVKDGEVHYRAGERIQWGVSFTSPLEMLHLTVRVNPEVTLCEDNLDSVNYGKKIGRLLNSGVTLGQVLDGILWELSFHGAPESRKQEKADLKRLADAVDAGTAITHQSMDLFAEYKATLAVCFDEAAGHSADELYDALLEIGDRDDAETSFRERLGPVRLKAPFSRMTGMELRAHVRRNSNIAF